MCNAIGRTNQLTCSSQLHLLSHDPKYSEHLDHYFHDDILHRLRRRHLGVFLETSEEILDAFEDVDQRIVAGNNVLCRLEGIGIRTI